MAGREIIYRPRKPVGEPYRGRPGGEQMFPREGTAGEPPSAAPPPAEQGAYVLPEDGATAGQIPPSSTYAEAQARAAEAQQPSSLPGQAPVFTKPGRGPLGAPPSAPVTDAQRKAKTALTIGIASLLVLHIPLGPVAIYLGLKAARAGERRASLWAVATGVGGTLIGVAGLVLYATGSLPTLDELMKDRQ